MPRFLSFVAVATLALAACDRNPTAPTAPSDRHPAASLDASGALQPEVEAGNQFTCAVDAQSTARCWGLNNYGQVSGAGSAVGAVAISAGDQHGCAVIADGSVRCWGNNVDGRAPPVGPTFNATQVSAGDNFSCALRADGPVVCWGASSSGQLAVPGPGPFTQVSAGSRHACAVASTGFVSCWGSSTSGQTYAPNGSGPFTQVSAGGSHSCAVRIDGQVLCWGSNSSGQSAPPADLGPVLAVAAGTSHTCAVKTDNTVACWGSQAYGQSTPPSGLANVIQVTADQYHSCALVSDGTVSCWGSMLGIAVPSGLNLLQAPPSIVFDAVPPSPSVVGQSYPVSVTSTSGGATTLTSTTTEVCTVDGWTVTMLAAGDCTIQVDQAADGNFLAAQASLTVLAKVVTAQSITFTSTPPSPAYVGGSYLVTATGGASGNAVTFSSLTPLVCGVTSGGSTSFVATGTCTVAADQAGNDDYAAAPRLTQSFTVQSAPQLITFTSAAANPAYVGTSYTVRATGGASGNPVVFSTLTPSVCGVSGDVVSLLAAGLCTVAANQSGGASYGAAAQVTQSFLVSKVPQTITFTSTPPSPALVGASYALSATGGGSGNAVTFTSLTPSVCVLSAATLSFVGVGTCTVAADQAGNGAYLAAPQSTQSVGVVYPFTGYDGFANAPALNQARAGSTISLDFSLGGDRGLNVLGPGSPTTVSLPNCGTTPSGLESPRTVTNRTLSYNKRTGNYTLSFTSDKAWLGTCRQLVMRLADGTEHRANYQFSR